ncbi:NAD(P)-dependent oxidoreductase [Alsobacter soli]|uniref:NAD(P)-dependent oxidoreductase n=1 Tax=Alsobacter soli TaxID=2109933 RepID=A0A2T1HP55_9HYPH|nr:NAD(P)-dependent oxidoreductase [Alsobacter soli]
MSAGPDQNRSTRAGERTVSTERERIGFIGVGLMGHGMAKNIVEKGYPLTVMGHRNRKPVEDLLGRGAREAKSAREVGEASDIVFLCVTGSREVEGLVRGPDGLAAGLKSGSVIVDCSTSDPNSTLALAAELEPHGITYVDAPLSRTPKEAWEGMLDTMVGASPEVFARLKPVLDAWAGRVIHIGGTGDGHRMKLLNNFIAMGYAALFSEALALAQKVGITPERFDSVIRGGRMDCGFYQTFMKWTLEGDREAHKFTLNNAFKDMRYLESMADAAGLANPMGNAVKNAYAVPVATGKGEDYVPMLSTHVAALNGVELKRKV